MTATAVLSSAFEQDTCGASDANVLRQGVPCADAKAASRWLSELLRLSGTRIITAGRAGALRIAAHGHHTPLAQVPSRHAIHPGVQGLDRWAA